MTTEGLKEGEVDLGVHYHCYYYKFIIIYIYIKQNYTTQLLTPLDYNYGVSIQWRCSGRC